MFKHSYIFSRLFSLYFSHRGLFGSIRVLFGLSHSSPSAQRLARLRYAIAMASELSVDDELIHKASVNWFGCPTLHIIIGIIESYGSLHSIVQSRLSFARLNNNELWRWIDCLYGWGLLEKACPAGALVRRGCKLSISWLCRAPAAPDSYSPLTFLTVIVTGEGGRGSLSGRFIRPYGRKVLHIGGTT